MIRRVTGKSMIPTLAPGDIVISFPFGYKKGSLVLAKMNNREVVKRVEKLKNEKVYLIGDNNLDSTDSRHYGPVHKSAILGNIMIVLPKPTMPPKLVKPYGVWLGRGVAAVLVIIALVHLFRIDTLVPILDEILPGGYVFAGVMTSVIIFSEIFAIPFALRMKLSPLMHAFSGVLIAFAPLWWLVFSIWTFGSEKQIGQLGEFLPIYSSTLLILINTAWVALSYFTLYTLGYNRLSLPLLLRK